jgi:hypothetical protein
MHDVLPDIEALMQWTRDTLAAHGPRCVCRACLALVRAEAGMDEIRRILAKYDAQRQREDRQQRFGFLEAPYDSR